MKLIVDDKHKKQYISENHLVLFDKITGSTARIPFPVTHDGCVAPLPVAELPNFPVAVGALIEQMIKYTASLKLGNEPFSSPDGPEILDISITTRCDKGCSYCYMDSTPGGSDMSVDSFRMIMSKFSHTAFQVALGGGEPTLHPEFTEILRISMEEFGVVPNYTTNGDFLLNSDMSKAASILTATSKYCGAVAVSAHGDKDEYLGKAKILSSKIKTNIHFVLSNKTLDAAVDLMNTIPNYINSIVFLVFKPTGRGTDSDVISPGNKDFKKFIERACKMDKVGFDACSAPFLTSMTSFDTSMFDACECSRFSAYIGVDSELKACSFDKSGGIKITEKCDGTEIWNELQSEFHPKINSRIEGCNACSHVKACMGGCPLFPQIVNCTEKMKED